MVPRRRGGRHPDLRAGAPQRRSLIKTSHVQAQSPLVAERHRVPDLSAQLRRQQWRRRRRHCRHHRQARLSAAARHRRHLAVTDLRVANGRQWLRHRRLPGDRPRVRHARRFRPAGGRGQVARHRHSARSRGQPHLRRSPLVQGFPQFPSEPPSRFLYLARSGGGRRAAQRSAIDLRRPRLDARRGDRAILPAPVLDAAARSQLGQPRGAR